MRQGKRRNGDTNKENKTLLYFADKLSPHIALSAEGYLICRDVPVARSGTQEYRPEELGIFSSGTEGDPEDDRKVLRTVTVFRPEEEVFSPETIASFEGKPVTEDHPDIPEGVTAENIRLYQKGHAQNIRRGKGAGSSLLLADLVITDPETIRHIQAGKREISCGYTYTLSREDGRWVQRDIRGNHIAVVDKGRAGPRVCIRDGKPSPITNLSTQPSERRHYPMKKSLTKLLARMAKDGDIETVAEFIEEMLDPETGDPSAAPAENTAPAIAVAVSEPETAEPAAEEAESVEADPPETAADESVLQDIISRLDRLIELLTPAPAPETDEDPEEDIREIVEELLEAAEPEDSGFLETEEMSDEDDPESCDPDEEEPRPAADHMIRSAVRALKPIIASLPKDRRKQAADAAMRALRSAGNPPCPSASPYAALARAARKPDPADLGRRIIQSRNVNYKH